MSNGTSPVVLLVVRFGRAAFRLFDTVRAGYALGPERDHSPAGPVGGPVWSFDLPPALPAPDRVAIPAPKGCSPTGVGVPPLKGGTPHSPSPSGSATRRAADALALIVWRAAGERLRSHPRFRLAVMDRAARHANRPSPARRA